MAEEAYVHTMNGLEVEQSDINMMSSVGALADDHVLAELLRLTPFNGAVAKAIMPFAHVGASVSATVSPAGASGSVVVAPFRAIVGTRDTVANVGSKAAWNEIRSGIFTAKIQGTGTLTDLVPLAANTTAFTRWDLIYAQLVIDANGQTNNRYRKDPATEQVTVVTVVRTKVQNVTLGIVPGNPAQAPQKPTLAPDSATTFYFPLAYVRVPAGFSPTSIVATTDIVEVMPCVPLSRVTGAATLGPANQQHKEGGTVLSNPAFAWTGAPGQRPGPFMPPTMVGAESLLVAMDLFDSNAANWSHPSGSVVDSRDWRFRVFDWRAFGRRDIAVRFAWDRTLAIASFVPQVVQGGGFGSRYTWGFGQSFAPDNPPLGAGASTVAIVEPANISELAQGCRVQLYVDHTDGGKLKVNVTGAPGSLLFFWITCSAPYANY